MRSAKWILVAVAAIAVAGSAMAQPPGGGRGGNRGGAGGGAGQPGGGRGMGGGGGGVATLLANEGVQKELKITDEQKSKIKEFSDAQRQKMRDAMADGQPDREKMQELQKAATEAAEKFVKDTLNADQQKRVKQISTQQMGLRAFSNEEVAKSLKLTDEQKEKIKGLGEEMQKDMQELRGGGGGGGINAEAIQKMATIRKEYMAKAADALTADQKSTWKSLVGEPFEVQMGGGRGAAGAGGTGGNRGGNRPPRGGNGGNPPPV